MNDFAHQRLDAYRIALDLAVRLEMTDAGRARRTLETAARVGAMLTGLIAKFS